MREALRMFEAVVGLYRRWLCYCNSLYVFVVCTLTWKNGFAECVEFKLKINQSINQSGCNDYLFHCENHLKKLHLLLIFC